MASSFGIDLSLATSYDYTTTYSGFFDSPLYVVGSINNLRSFTELEIVLAKDLATGEGIQIKYRVNLTDSFTAVKTPNGGTLSFDFATLGAVISHHVIADIPACEMLQIRVELEGTTTTTPQFKSLTLR